MSHFPQLDAFRGGADVTRVVGHRGARGVMPESTLAGFEFTLNCGVQALELDVLMTGDGVPVITHNPRLSPDTTRDANGHWLQQDGPRLMDLTFDELSAYDVGGTDGRSTYGQRFPDQAFLQGVSIPSLSDLIDVLQKPAYRSAVLLLEMKSAPDVPADEVGRRAFVEAVMRVIRDGKVQDRTVLHSFDWDLLDATKDVAPDMPRSYLSEISDKSDPSKDMPTSVGPDFRTFSVSIPQAVADVGGVMWCPQVKDVTKALVDEAHDLGLLVSTWTVNTPEDIQNMIDAGVDGIVTDYPGRVQQILRQNQRTW